jgi:hypothetical protein
MDMFMDHKVQEQAIGQMGDAEKKEKRRLMGQRKTEQGAMLSALRRGHHGRLHDMPVMP